MPLEVFLPVQGSDPFHPSGFDLETGAMLGTLLFVLIVELLNSSVEAVVDRISYSKHGLSKRAKDYGSAAVMLALLLCGLTYAVIFMKYFL